MNVSVTIIGHNEVNHLLELLPQLNWADEIVYVDCDSQDNSLNVAKTNGCRVFSRPNNYNLNVNKSYAIEQAINEWIFYIDPDERISEKLGTEIKKVIKNTNNSAFKLNRRNHCFGVWLKNGSQYPDVQIRLFRKNSATFPNKHVHEKLSIKGKLGILENDLHHFPYTDISQFLRKFDFYTEIEASYLQNSGTRVTFFNSIKFLIFKPLTRFVRRYIIKGGFRDGFPGLFFAIFDALNFVVRYLKLWEYTKISKK
tara:strand:- start:1590 stop:2354 length:765 start_codon:yes stop_codon:yes gene_type:complete